MVKQKQVQGTGRCVTGKVTCSTTLRGLRENDLTNYKDHWVSQRRHTKAVERYNDPVKKATLAGFDLWSEYLALRGFHPSDIGRLKRSVSDRDYKHSYRGDRSLLLDIQEEFSNFKEFVLGRANARERDVRQWREDLALRRRMHRIFLQTKSILPLPNGPERLEDGQEEEEDPAIEIEEEEIEPEVEAPAPKAPKAAPEVRRTPPPPPKAPPKAPAKEPAAPVPPPPPPPPAPPAPAPAEPLKKELFRNYIAAAREKERELNRVRLSEDERAKEYYTVLSSLFPEGIEARMLATVQKLNKTEKKVMEPAVDLWRRVRGTGRVADPDGQEIIAKIFSTIFTQRRVVW